MRVRNSIYQIAKYFGEADPRFMDFWKGLTPEEKAYYCEVDLVTGKMPVIFRIGQQVRVVNDKRLTNGLVGMVWETPRATGQVLVRFANIGRLDEFMDRELELVTL